MTKTALQLEVERIAKLRNDAQREVDNLSDLMHLVTAPIAQRWESMGAFSTAIGCSRASVDPDSPITNHPDYDEPIPCFVIQWWEYASYGNDDISRNYYVPVSLALATDQEIKYWLTRHADHLKNKETRRQQEVIEERRNRLMKEVEALNRKLGEIV